MSLQTFVGIIIFVILGLLVLLLVESAWALLLYKIAEAWSFEALRWWTTNGPIQVFLRFLPLEAVIIFCVVLIYKYKKSSSTRELVDKFLRVLEAKWLYWLMEKGYKYLSRFFKNQKE